MDIVTDAVAHAKVAGNAAGHVGIGAVLDAARDAAGGIADLAAVVEVATDLGSHCDDAARDLDGLLGCVKEREVRER